MWFRSQVLILISILCATGAFAGERDADAITADLHRRHLPFGTVLDPIFVAPDSEEIQGYTRCGDSALWTGFYLGAESYRYATTGSQDALDNAWRALSGIRLLLYVTGNNALARCAFPMAWDFAPGILQEEQRHVAWQGSYEGQAYYWIGNTSRDQYLGVFFGLAAAWDLIDDEEMRATIADITWKLLDHLDLNDWNVRMPDGSRSTTFLLRSDQRLSLLAVGRHILPERFGSDYSSYATRTFFLSPLTITYDALDVYNSYFKFNLDTVALYSLIRLENNPTRRSAFYVAYDTMRATTDDHQNAHFNMIDRALAGPNERRDEETVRLLELWLKRPRRDFGADLREPQYADRVKVCFEYACEPVPVDLRIATDFLWQRTPFQLSGGGNGFIENAGIDYLLPYWMARYYGVAAPDAAGVPVRSVPPEGQFPAPRRAR